MNYFEFYQIPEAFFIDENELRQKYHQITKQLHPDFFTKSSEIEQMVALEKSTLNNQAYKTLSGFESRMAYILELHGLLQNSPTLPQSFLMQMMDINEAIEEGKTEMVTYEVQKMKENLWKEIEPVLKNYLQSTDKNVDLNKILMYYLKTKYLDRLLTEK
jgi:molecular chaperone HscB